MNLFATFLSYSQGRVQRLIVTGGGSVNGGIAQVLADVFQMEVYTGTHLLRCLSQFSVMLIWRADLFSYRRDDACCSVWGRGACVGPAHRAGDTSHRSAETTAGRIV